MYPKLRTKMCVQIYQSFSIHFTLRKDSGWQHAGLPSLFLALWRDRSGLRFNSFCGTKSYVILLWKRLLNWSLCCCAFKMRFQLVSEGVGHVSISLMVTKLKIASFGTDHRSTTISWNTLQAGKIQGAFKSGYQNSWFKFKLDFSQDELLKLI